MGRNSSLSTESPWRVLCLLTFTGAAVTWYLCSWFSLWSLLLHFYVMRQACVVVVVVVVSCSAAAASLQSCPTLCDPIDGSPPGSAVPGILQARTLEWVAIAFSNAWKWKGKVKLLSRVRLLATPWTAAHQAPPSMGFFQARVLEWGAIAFSVSVAQSCLTLCHPVDYSTPGFPVLQYLPEFAQTRAHWVGDVIQLSRPLSSPSLPAFNLSQHQGVF